jgi:hypothetical protein
MNEAFVALVVGARDCAAVFSMLSFEEFRAIKNREVLQKEQSASSTTIPKVSKLDKIKGNKAALLKDELDLDADGKAAEVNNNTTVLTTSWRQALGEFLELNQTQYLYLMLLLLDTFVAFAEISLAKNYFSTFTTTVQRILRLSQAFITFTSMFFVIEIVLSYIAFGLALLGHWGYALDSLVIFCQASWEYLGIGRETRVLNILRIWRLFRLISTLINSEREQTEQVSVRVNILETEISQLQILMNDHKLEISKEQDARKAVEDMLVSYKEEVDTLNEALKIAAMDIAEVGQDDDNVDLYSLDSDELNALESKEQEDTLSRQGSLRKLEKLKGVMSASGSSVTGSIEDKTSMFVVREDGSYIKT